MDTAQVQTMLTERGIWEAHLELELWPLMSEFGPPGALAAIHCFRFIDTTFQPARDQSGYGWRPVAIIHGELYIDPSPEMFALILHTAGYFAQPYAFQELLIIQIHSFSLNGYNVYQVREDETSFPTNSLSVRGRAFRGASRSGWQGRFVTRAAPGEPVTIEFNE